MENWQWWICVSFMILLKNCPLVDSLNNYKQGQPKFKFWKKKGKKHEQFIIIANQGQQSILALPKESSKRFNHIKQLKCVF